MVTEHEVDVLRRLQNPFNHIDGIRTAVYDVAQDIQRIVRAERNLMEETDELLVAAVYIRCNVAGH